MDMRPGLDVHRNDVRSGLGEGFEVRIAWRDHQMDIERLFGERTNRANHVRPDGNVGDEMAVHDIDMDPIGAGGVDRAYFLAEFGKIGGQDGRRDDERTRHGILPSLCVRVTRHFRPSNASDAWQTAICDPCRLDRCYGKFQKAAEVPWRARMSLSLGPGSSAPQLPFTL